MQQKPIIVALDFNSANDALTLVDQLDPEACRLKVGKELFTACGPALVKQLVERDFDLFLDLKFHDIPNTVSRAVRTAADLGVWMINVHASGGLTMLEMAREALQSHGDSRPLLIGVTVLTSLGAEDLQQIGIDHGPRQQVIRLAELCHRAGLDGVVCSAAETPDLRAQLPAGFVLVTPGIRRAQDAAGDQKRVVGPAEAVRNGSDFLVVGRPISRAPSPAEALAEFNSALAGVSETIG